MLRQNEQRRAQEQQISEMIRAIRTRTFTVELPPGVRPSEGELECPVCLCSYEPGEELRVLPCKHEFHRSCIDAWLLTLPKNYDDSFLPSCPLCKLVPLGEADELEQGAGDGTGRSGSKDSVQTSTDSTSSSCGGGGGGISAGAGSSTDAEAPAAAPASAAPVSGTATGAFAGGLGGWSSRYLGGS